MKKLRLNFAQGAEEILTRDELRAIVGGLGSDSSYTCKCTITDVNGNKSDQDVTLTEPSWGNCKLGCSYECRMRILNHTGCVGFTYSYDGPSTGSGS